MREMGEAINRGGKRYELWALKDGRSAEDAGNVHT
jgi:hypothetical protein